MQWVTLYDIWAYLPFFKKMWSGFVHACLSKYDILVFHSHFLDLHAYRCASQIYACCLTVLKQFQPQHQFLYLWLLVTSRLCILSQPLTGMQVTKADRVGAASFNIITDLRLVTGVRQGVANAVEAINAICLATPNCYCNSIRHQ